MAFNCTGALLPSAPLKDIKLESIVMTTFGHSLTGLAFLMFVIPRGITWWRRLAWAVLFIALACIPDWPLPGWGHSDIAFSHSLWVNLVLCIAVAIVFRKGSPDRFGATPILLAASFSWLSHILLDTLYGDLPGVAIFWPFSDALVSLPVPWLKTLPHVPPPFDTSVVRILIFEFLTFTPLVFFSCYVRRKMGAQGRR